MKLPATMASLVLIAFGGASLAAEPPARFPGDPAAILEEVLAPYRQLAGIHYRAHFSFTLWDAAGRETTGESSAEYWGSGEGFRSETEVDPRLARAGFMGGMIVTFDGLESRLLYRAQGSLVVRRGEMPDVSMTPNLIFLPIDFLKVAKLDCQVCRATLADIRTSGNASTFLPEGTAVRSGEDDPESVVVTLPATPADLRKEITLARRSGAWVVQQVVLYDALGNLNSRQRFSNPLSPPGAPPGFAPARTVVLEGWVQEGDGPDGTVRMEIRGEVTHLDLIPTFYWSEFTLSIDTDLAQTVVDGDSGQVLRAGSCKVPLPERPNPFAAP